MIPSQELVIEKWMRIREPHLAGHVHACFAAEPTWTCVLTTLPTSRCLVVCQLRSTNQSRPVRLLTVESRGEKDRPELRTSEIDFRTNTKNPAGGGRCLA